MKRIARFFIPVMIILSLPSCHNSDWEGMPSQISEFLSKYFPGQDISDFGSSDDGYHVRLRNSAAVTFNNTCSWMSINGYGGTLPQMLLFDELPPVLYEYLQETESLDGVYAVSRDTKTYFVRLLDSDLVYNTGTDEITQKR